MTIKRNIVAVAVAAAVLAAIGSGLYVTNAAPRIEPVAAAAANSGKLYVVKLHAQWCPYCMLTKGVWSKIEAAYRGKVNVVVLDFTTKADTVASRAEAARLGLERFFDEYAGATGIVVVLDGRTKEVTAEIGGSRDFDEYRAAIDAALQIGQ